MAHVPGYFGYSYGKSPSWAGSIRVESVKDGVVKRWALSAWDGASRDMIVAVAREHERRAAGTHAEKPASP